jgi:hypothetical protein
MVFIFLDSRLALLDLSLGGAPESSTILGVLNSDTESSLQAKESLSVMMQIQQSKSIVRFDCQVGIIKLKSNSKTWILVDRQLKSK